MLILGRLIYEKGKWMELAKDDVQWQAAVLEVLNLWVLLCLVSFPWSKAAGAWSWPFISVQSRG